MASQRYVAKIHMSSPSPKAPAAGAGPRPGTRGETASTSIKELMDKGTDRPFRELLYRLLRLGNVMAANQEHFARYIGVQPAQLMMMAVVLDTDQATVGDIAAQLEVSSQFVTREMGKLVRKGLIEKRDNEADGRSVLLTLAPLGRRLMNELGPLRRSTNDRMFRSLDDGQIAQLRDIVEILVRDGKEGLHELEAPQFRHAQAPSLAAKKPARGRS